MAPLFLAEFPERAGRGGATPCWTTRGDTKLDAQRCLGCPSKLPTVKWKWLRVWQAHAYLPTAGSGCAGTSLVARKLSRPESNGPESIRGPGAFGRIWAQSPCVSVSSEFFVFL